MTEQEKKIIDLIEAMNYEVHESGQVNLDSHTTAKAIIKAFPQITKKPVKIVKIPSSNGLFGIKFDEVNGSGNERQAWIDSHFCEVVE